ncbi:MAG: S-adenosylmethionine:tRNA ribosyltransferase-isomerase [Parcubacteria group bacterium LiPW_41]|nr:MAG: S-adenosylmethionine:tRNA ribosyltransferase-isomerase [Parcubacteria group bacterium LiPW_41]
MNQYFYELPRELIAQKPAEPRDSSRLFVYDTKTDEIFFDVFRNCGEYIPSGSTLILNKTKVVPARVYMEKETGGKIEVLFLINEYGGGKEFLVIVDRKLIIGQKLFFPNRKAFEVIDQKDQFFTLKCLFDESEIFSLLEIFGTTPIPKYIHEHNLSESVIKDRYQSIFAETPASIAAPTASLHFTNEVFESLKKKDVITAEILLHVGMGTFAPVSDVQIQSGMLHKEWYSIPKETEEVIKLCSQKSIIPVGTTAMRALESFAKTEKNEGITNLFIKRPFQFRVASGLITNFHVPESSLMFLVDAFLEYKHSKRTILDLYKIAIKEKFRFYSFGDAMYIK